MIPIKPLPLRETSPGKRLFKQRLDILIIGLGHFHLIMRRVEQHGRAEAIFPIFALQNRVVDAAGATVPELIVIGQFRIGNRVIAQFVIDLHHGQTGSQSEEFRTFELLERQEEGQGLDRLGEAQLTELGIDDQTRVGYIVAMAPAFDVAETGPGSVFVQRDHGFAVPHFTGNIFRGTFGDTRPRAFADSAISSQIALAKGDMLLGGHHDVEIFDTHFFNTLNLNA